MVKEEDYSSNVVNLHITMTTILTSVTLLILVILFLCLVCMSIRLRLCAGLCKQLCCAQCTEHPTVQPTVLVTGLNQSRLPVMQQELADNADRVWEEEEQSFNAANPPLSSRPDSWCS